MNSRSDDPFWLGVTETLRTDRPLLTIDLAAIAENTWTVKARTSAEVMAVVKADGFGHGAEELARTALGAGATWLGVTNLDEGLALRRAGFGVRILSWLNAPGADLRAAARAGIEVAVPDRILLGEAASVGQGLAVHLHLDTGMSRGGAGREQWADLCAAAQEAELAGRIRVVGVMSHLGRADDPYAPDNARSVRRFRDGVVTAWQAGLRPAVLHLAATAATLTNPMTHFDLVRIGAGLVGIDPSGTTWLRGAMTLTAPLVQVQRVEPGTPVGYGHTWHAPTPTQLGLIPLGYADGLPRLASDRAEVWLRGRRHRVVGLISMDQTVIDLADTPAAPGDTVTLFGPGDRGEPTVAEWAGWADTIPHELVTRIGSRVGRRILEPEPAA